MNQYEKVKQWHHDFDPNHQTTIHALNDEQSFYRASFMLEEMMEYLAATRSDDELIATGEAMKKEIDRAILKITKKEKEYNAVVDQADALIDLLYFIYGTFVKMNVDPNPLFDIVHEANMAKLFPDGKPHYDKITGKVLKPEGWEEHYAPENKLKKAIQEQREKQDD